MITQKYINDIAYKTIGCAIEVHKNLGPGLLESVYEICLIEELSESGLLVKSQVYVPIIYKGKDLGGTLKLDLFVNDPISYRRIRQTTKILVNLSALSGLVIKNKAFIITAVSN